MDFIVKCSNCNKGYRFKDATEKDKDKSFFSNKININPKIHCKCGNIYVWNVPKHTFQWTMSAS